MIIYAQGRDDVAASSAAAGGDAGRHAHVAKVVVSQVEVGDAPG